MGSDFLLTRCPYFLSFFVVVCPYDRWVNKTRKPRLRSSSKINIAYRVHSLSGGGWASFAETFSKASTLLLVLSNRGAYSLLMSPRSLSSLINRCLSPVDAIGSGMAECPASLEKTSDSALVDFAVESRGFKADISAS